MYRKSIFLTLYLCCILLSGNIFAQSENQSTTSDEVYRRTTFKHAMNICPIAPIFGIYALNYEYLFSPKNGLIVRVEYEDVPKSYADANIRILLFNKNTKS